MVRISLEKMKNKFKLNEDKKKKLVTWITILSFLMACVFMAFKDGHKAEASAVSLAGYFIEPSRAIAGAYLPETGKIYVNIGWKLTADYNLYEFNPDVYDSLQENPATFDNHYQYDFAAAGSINNKVFFIGGWNSYYGPSDKIFEFTPDTLTIVGHLPVTLVAPAYATYNGAIYMAGGLDEWGSETIYSSVYRYDGQNITEVGTLPVPLYDAAAEFTNDGKMIIFGGRGPTGELNSIIEFDPLTGEGTQIGTIPRACGGIRAARVGDSIYVFIPGDSTHNVTEIYEFKDGRLSKLKITIPERLSQTCAITVGKRIFLFCGRDPYAGSDSYKIWSFNTTLIPPDKVTLSITQDGNNISLSWGAVPYAVRYHIEHSTDGVNWTEIAVTTGTSYTGTLNEPGTHYYRARGESEGGAMGDYSNVVSAIIKPPAPTGLRATVDQKTVTLMWDAVSCAQSYIVQRSLDGETWTQIGETTQINYIDDDTRWETTYFYRVIAKANGVESDPYSVVEVVTGTMPTPTNLRVENLEGTKVTLAWDSLDGFSSYVIERSSDNKTWSQVGTSNTATYIDQAQAGKTYYYRVKAKDEDQTSSPSNVVSVRTNEEPPPPPQIVTGLTATWTGDRIRVSWLRGENKIPDGHIELWKQIGNGVWIPVKSISSSECDAFVWEDKDVSTGLNYRYELRVLGGFLTGFTWQKFAESGWATGDRPLPAPGSLRVSVTETSATLSWDIVSGASSYTVAYSFDQGGTWQTKTVSGTSTSVPRGCIARVRAGSNSHWSGTITVP